MNHCGFYFLPFNDDIHSRPYAKYNDSTNQLVSPVFSQTILDRDIWFEGDNKGHSQSNQYTENNIFNKITSDNHDRSNSLLYKTHKLFQAHDHNGIDTLIGRYHTSGDRDTTHNEKSLLQSAVNDVFGMSHGRNLLTRESYNNKYNVNRVEGYSNPYCRVWTKSLRYGMTNHLIRPFIDNEGMIIDMKDIQNTLKTHIRNDDGKGVEFLKDNSVLNNNGFITITPTEENRAIKKYMFSIENLAWKDYGNKYNLSEEQIGPNGGRIMWFPPYGLTVQDNVGVDWGPNDFIGRGEKIYSYKNTERSGTLSFILLVDNPSILSEWNQYGKKDVLAEEQEQQLLRFFAGCEPLELHDRIDKKEYEYETEIKYDENDIVFYIFFPNNYSGIDDDFNDALDYLINKYDNFLYDEFIYENLPWKYRVDYKYRNQKLSNGNYEDRNQYKINIDLNFSYLSGETKKHFKSMYEDVTHGLSEMKNDFKRILKNKIIDKVILESGSTNVGDKSLNKELSKNRMNFGEKFVKNVLLIQNAQIEKNYSNAKIISLNKTDSCNVSSLNSKLNRYVKIILKTKEKKNKSLFETFNDTVFFGLPNEDLKKIKYDYGYRKVVRERSKVETVTMTGFKDEKQLPHRSDEEYKYFKMLESNNSFLYNKLVDKIKYFTPAFHSITPEGFNSRLSFLHQCTRQGPTLSISDTNNELKSAGNLAFGRPPICVLRIGDFYHTRIIIDSLTIDFADSTWDMNPEGIGVQPMLAKVTLNFKFLGGSDLCAPVSRLQNALSFNYYANQGVYDNRSDKGKYDDKKNSVIEGKPWTPK